MFSHLAKNPADYAAALAQELARRGRSLDPTDLPQLRAAAEYAIRTAYYATLAKSFLTRPLRDRKIEVDGADWRSCGVKLYGLWQRLRPTEVERRMTELRERHANDWRSTFPDDHNIDEQKLRDLYKAGPALLINGVHDWNDVSMALRYYVAEQLAAHAASLPSSGGGAGGAGGGEGGGGGGFDWGGSDGISCLFLRHHGLPDVHLFEPNPNAQAFGQYLAQQLQLTDLHFHQDDPPPPGSPLHRTYAVGVCTEVLEHVVDPQRMMHRFFDLLRPGGVIFVTSSFAVPQDTHLKSNLQYAGKESDMMRAAGFHPWEPPSPRPVPFLPVWGFWQKPM